MLADPLSVTYNAVAKSLVKVNQDSYSSEYYLDDTATSGIKFTLTVNNNLPKKGTVVGESHMMKLKGEFINGTTGLVDRTISVWIVERTDDGAQDFTSAKRMIAAFLTAASTTNTDKMLGRES